MMDIRRTGDTSQDEDGEKNAQAQAETSGSRAGGGGSSVFGSVLLIIGLIVLVAAGVYFFGDFGSGLPGSGPVARVGDATIERSDFNEQLNNLRQSTSSRAQQFKSLDETRQQELVLAGMINRELLRQAAQQSGVSVSDSEVDQRLQQQIEQTGGESAFQQRLQQSDITRSQVRENLKEQMLVNRYVSQAAGTSTDQQVQQLYDQFTARLRQQSGTSSAQIPSLEQLRPQLEARLQQRRQQQLLQQARNNIEVEVLIDGVDYPPTTGQQQTQQTGNQSAQQGANQGTNQTGQQNSGTQQ